MLIQFGGARVAQSERGGSAAQRQLQRFYIRKPQWLAINLKRAFKL